MKTLENRKAKRTRISRCKLSKKDQLKMIEFFALGITARSVADIMQMQPNTSALFYRKLREIISINLNVFDVLRFYWLGTVTYCPN